MIFAAGHGDLLADTSLKDYNAIVIARDASPAVAHAAKDLQYYLGKIDGRHLPITQKPEPEGLSFFIGPGVAGSQEAEVTALPPEGWLIRTIPGGILLAGGESEVNPRYAFYHSVPLFLKNHCKVRWLWPGASGEVVPFNPELKFPDLDESGTPLLKRRRVDFYLNRYWAPEVRDAFRRWERLSLQGDQINVKFNHAWAALFNEKDFHAHPEWFAEVAGKRMPPTEVAMNWQLCLSNRQMRDVFYKRLTRDISADVGVSVSANDGGGFCECAECLAAGGTAVIYWDFVVDMARRLAKEHPQNRIGTFAYNFYREAPKQIKELPPNVVISMTALTANHLVPGRREEFLAYMESWKALKAPLILREYWGAHYWQDLPVLYPREIADGIKISTRNGMIGVYGEGGKNWSTQAPNYYVLMQTMWNPEISTEKVLTEFYDCFGPAKEPVRAYFELFEEAVRREWTQYNLLAKWRYNAHHYARIFNPKLMEQAAALLEQAKACAKDDKALQEKIAFLSLGYRYTELIGRLFTVYNQLGIGRFREISPTQYTSAQRRELLEKAWSLGQERIRILNEARHTFAFDDGVYINYKKVHSSYLHHAEVAALLGKSEADWLPLEGE